MTPDASTAQRRRSLRWIAYAFPLLVAALLLGVYLVAPEFYLTYVLEERRREYQAVEIVTTLSGLTASLILFGCAGRLWRLRDSLPAATAAGRTSPLARLGPALIVALIAAATFVFVGEEISWGQTYLRWDTPQTYRELSGETNLHNIDLPISMQGLGSLFLLTMLVGLPIAWRLRLLPASWAPAIAEGPVIFTLLVGFAIKEFKSVYKSLVQGAQTQRFYLDFVEQLNEHKEMYAALALLMYAIYRVAAVRRASAEPASAGVANPV